MMKVRCIRCGKDFKSKSEIELEIMFENHSCCYRDVPEKEVKNHINLFTNNKK